MNSIAEIKKLYASAIVNDLLELKEGESLSINTHDDDFSFAKIVAQEALLVTKCTVKLVVIENGRALQVVDFESDFPTSIRQGQVMLSISHVRRNIKAENAIDITLEADDFPALQAFSHLSEPIVLDRKIAIPYCVAQIYDDEDLSSWNQLNKKLELGLKNQILVSKYRVKELNQKNIKSIKFFNSNDTLSLNVSKDSLFINNTYKLRDEREFSSTLDFDRIFFIAESDSLNGTITAKATILGKNIRSKLKFKNGRLVNWECSKGLNNLLSFDENLKKVGFITMRDKELIISLGGSLVECLAKMPESEDELPKCFNQSFYTIKFEAENFMNIIAKDCDDNIIEIAKDGLFLF